MVEREEMRKKKTELLIKALKLEKIVVEQKRKNQIKQEEKSKIKINLNMEGNNSDNKLNSDDGISTHSTLLHELKKLSSNISHNKNKCKYFHFNSAYFLCHTFFRIFRS